ncbi:MAG: thioredoxin domain-containing protein [Chitinophagales bacterium]|nr:thioredoxin domain-containing protein [Chitinophagales bacterium]
MKYFNSLLIVLSVSVTSAFAQTSGAVLDAPVFRDKITATSNAVLLDVRTPDEYEQGHIEGAKNLDYRSSAFQTELGMLDKSKPYFVYCLSGGRSAGAADYMRNNGFKVVYDLKGGMLSWQKNNLPVVTSEKVAADKISIAAYNKMIATGTVLVDFYAPWCAPCKKMEPWLNEITKEYAGKAQIARINVDENKDLAKQLGITAIPVLKIYKNGKETWMHKGYAEKAQVVSNL